jgi:hypothetical protein
MAVLGHTYRYQVYNGTGVSVTCTVKERPWKFASDGARTDAAESTRINAVSVTTATYSNSSTIDNSSVKNLGAEVLFTAAPGSSATGAVTLYLQHSTDGGTTWSSDGKGQPLTVVYFAASATSVTVDAEAG